MISKKLCNFALQTWQLGIRLYIYMYIFHKKFIEGVLILTIKNSSNPDTGSCVAKSESSPINDSSNPDDPGRAVAGSEYSLLEDCSNLEPDCMGCH